MKNTTGPNPLSDAEPGHRQVRSFVLREGRLTKAQARALKHLWPRFGIDNADTPIDLSCSFGPDVPVHLEIGFGNGEALLWAARQHPEAGFVGIEVHRPGVGALLINLEEHELDNVRLICADATISLERFPDDSLASVRLYFPDPWPKKRHHKRRIVQPPFVELVQRKLAPTGFFHLATDWPNYAEHMLAVCDAQPGLENQAGNRHYLPRPEWRPETRFERRGLKLGHEVRDLLFRKTGAGSD
jgi:tRNA (guanine-N7-)-methyltransferase